MKSVTKKKSVSKKKAVGLSKDIRNKKIRDLYETGKYTHRSLAVKVGLSKSRIGEIIG